MLIVMPRSRKVSRDTLDPQKIQGISGHFSALLKLLNQLSLSLTSFHKIFDTTIKFFGAKNYPPIHNEVSLFSAGIRLRGSVM